MLLGAVILVLREVLEASLLISILLVISQTLGFSRRWVFWGVGIGFVNAATYGLSVDIVSEWFDGVGQEVTNAVFQIAIYFLLVGILMLVTSRVYVMERFKFLILVLMSATVALAITREGFEIFIYLYSFSSDIERFSGVAIGAVIGASIGISVGVLLYFSVLNMLPKWSLLVAFCSLTLVAAGMLSQAVLLLIQADWLPAQLPLWDSSFLLSENSVAGQLMYALIGYESTPTPIQVGLYLAGLGLLLVLLVVARFNQVAVSDEHA